MSVTWFLFPSATASHQINPSRFSISALYPEKEVGATERCCSRAREKCVVYSSDQLR